MNNGDIFDLLNIIIRKEKEGDTISPSDFSTLLKMVSLEKGNSDYAYYEQSQVITDCLRSLLSEAAIPLASGVGDFTAVATDYWHMVGVNTSTAKVERLTEFQFDDYKYSDLLAPTSDYPVVKISGDDLVVLPVTITSVIIDYLKEPATPFYDYYIDVNDNYIYMPPGTSHLLVVGEEYRDGTTSGTVNSISVEVSYPEGERIHLIYMILQKIGIALNEQDAVQYGLAKEQKEEIQ